MRIINTLKEYTVENYEKSVEQGQDEGEHAILSKIACAEHTQGLNVIQIT